MTALVTGAVGGIGRAAVLALRGQGQHVVSQDIVAAHADGPALTGDLCDPGFLRTAVTSITEAGELTAVVVAHGITGAGRLDELEPGAVRTTMAVNFEAVVNLWDRVKTPLEQSGGVFAVVVSQAGLVGEAGNGLYCASKFALTGWLRGLAGETTARLRALYPGGIRTPLLERSLRAMADARGTTYEAFLDERYGTSPAGRIADPAELGQAVSWAVRLPTPGLVELTITGGEVLW